MIKVKCAKCNKTAFPTATSAINVIKRSKINATHVYQCKHNGTWHITTMTKLVVRKGFGGKHWEVSNGKTALKFDCYGDARQKAVAMANKYSNNTRGQMRMEVK